MQFVELAEVCFGEKRRRKYKLEGFRLLVIKGADEAVVISADLSGVTLRDRGQTRFAVVGSPLVKNFELTWGDVKVQSIYIGVPPVPVGDDSAYAIMLIHSKYEKDLRLFSLKKEGSTYSKLQLTPFLERELRKMNHDMVVYGRKVHTNRCHIFERLWPDLSILDPSKKYLLRDWDDSKPQSQKADYSLNRCTDSTDPHKPEAFQIDVTSPGEENTCKGKAFFIEDFVTQLTPLNPALHTATSIPGKIIKSTHLIIPMEQHKK